MSALRSFCLWMLMLALPLQGFAAASMRFCGTKAPPPALAGMQQAAAHDPLAHSGHQHAAHHGRAAGATEAAVQQASPATKAQAGMPALDTRANDPLTHKCTLCAGCCHAMALLEFFKPLEFGPLAHADLAEPLVLIQAMPVRVPEKPPRA